MTVRLEHKPDQILYNTHTGQMVVILKDSMSQFPLVARLDSPALKPGWRPWQGGMYYAHISDLRPLTPMEQLAVDMRNTDAR